MTDLTQADKPWYTSRTIIGIAVSFLGFVLQKFGFTVTPETQEVLTTNIVEIIAAIMQLVGLGYATYGRVKATKTIG